MEHEETRPLQVYCRRQKLPLPPPTELPSTSTDLPPTDLNNHIVLRKGIHSTIVYLISHFVFYDNLHPSFRTFALSISSKSISRNYQETLFITHWKAVMDDEM